MFDYLLSDGFLDSSSDLSFWCVAVFIPVVIFYLVFKACRDLINGIVKVGFFALFLFLGRWLFWFARKIWKGSGKWVRHLVLPRSRIWPEIGAADRIGSVSAARSWHGFRYGGVADAWVATIGIFMGLMHWTPLYMVVYPVRWLQSDYGIQILDFVEILFMAVAMTWVIGRYWTSLPRQNAIKSPVRIISSDGLNGKADFRVGRRIDTGQPVYLSANLLRHNLLGYGSPGSGKTSLAKLLMYQQIKRGGGLIFVDAKLDSTDVKDVFSFAREAGREQDLLFINPGDPAMSHSYNPILHGDDDEIAARCLALIPDSQGAGEDHYREAARRAIKATIAALRAMGLAFNFRDLSVILGSAQAMAALCGQLVEKVPDAEATADFAFLLNQFKSASGSYDVKRLQEMFGGIAGRLATFGTGGFGEVTSAYASEVELFKAIREQKIVYLSLPTMGKTEAAVSFAKIFVADLRTALSWLQALPEAERKLFLVFLDEAATYSMATMETMFSQNRSSGVSLIPLTQTPAQFQKVSQEFEKIITTGCKTKVFFQLADDAACEMAAKIVGHVSRSVRSVSEQKSSGANTNKASASPDGSDAGGKSKSFGEQEKDVFRVPPEDFAKLAVGEGIIRYDGRELVHFKADLPPSAPPEIQIVLHHTDLPAVEGARFYERLVLKDNVMKSRAADSETCPGQNEQTVGEDAVRKYFEGITF